MTEGTLVHHTLRSARVAVPSGRRTHIRRRPPDMIRAHEALRPARRHVRRPQRLRRDPRRDRRAGAAMRGAQRRWRPSDGQLHLHADRRPQRRVPGGRRARGSAAPLLCAREIAGARLDAARDPRADALLRAPTTTSPSTCTSARRGRCGSTSDVRISSAARRWRSSSRQRIARLPDYPVAGGYALPEHVAMLASNESPDPPLPEVVEAITRALARANRYPDPSVRGAAPRAGRPLRRSRPSTSRSATARATSCSRPARRCSSPAPRSSTRGRRSASTRTSRRRRARARSRCRSTTTTATTSTRWRPRSRWRRGWC